MRFQDYVARSRVEQWTPYYFDYGIARDRIRRAARVVSCLRTAVGVPQDAMTLTLDRHSPFAFHAAEISIGSDVMVDVRVITNDHDRAIAPLATLSQLLGSAAQSADDLPAPESASAKPPDASAAPWFDDDEEDGALRTSSAEKTEHGSPLTRQHSAGWKMSFVYDAVWGNVANANDSPAFHGVPAYVPPAAGPQGRSQRQMMRSDVPDWLWTRVDTAMAVRRTPPIEPAPPDVRAERSGAAAVLVGSAQDAVSAVRARAERVVNLMTRVDEKQRRADAGATLHTTPKSDQSAERHIEVTVRGSQSAASALVDLAGPCAYVLQSIVLDEFSTFFVQQVDKVERFYRIQARAVCAECGACVDALKRWSTLRRRDRDALTVAVRQAINSLDALQHFCDLNDVLLRRALLKFDAAMKCNAAAVAGSTIAHTAFHVQQPSRIESLKRDVEVAFTKHACGGATSLAASQLHISDATEVAEAEVTNAMTTGGLVSGTSVLGILALAEWAAMPGKTGDASDELAAYALAALGCIALLPLLFCVNVAVFAKYRINYVFMLELDPTTAWSWRWMISEAMPFSFTWSIAAYLFARSASEKVGALREEKAGVQLLWTTWPPNGPDGWTYPYLMLIAWFVLGVLRFAIPKWFKATSKGEPWLQPTLRRLLQTPRFAVRFPEFIVADELTSLASPIFEAQFIWCRSPFTSGTTLFEQCTALRRDGFLGLCLVPNLWRCMQCINRYREPRPERRTLFPHAVNAGKYFTDMSRMVVGWAAAMAMDQDRAATLHSLALLLTIAAALYKSWWDFFVDYATMRPFTWTWREERVYGALGIYVGASVLNTFLRFSWLLPLMFPVALRGLNGFALLSFLEVMRRFVWNFFRFENEQVNNIEHYRATRFVPLPRRAVDLEAWTPSPEQLSAEADAKSKADEIFARFDNFNQLQLLRKALDAAHACGFRRRAATQDGGDMSVANRGLAFALLPEEIKFHVILDHVGDAPLSSLLDGNFSHLPAPEEARDS